MGEHENNKRVLPSAEDLKGKKAAPQKRTAKWLAPLLLVLLLGGGWALYSLTDTFTPSEEPAATVAPSTTIRLIDKAQHEVERMSLSGSVGESYTLINRIQYDEEGTQLIDEEGQGESAPYEVLGQPYFAVNQGLAGSIHGNAASLIASEMVSEDPEDLSIYGLDEPRLTAVFEYDDGTRHTLYFGDQAPVGSSYYARMDEEEPVYIVGSSTFNALNKPLNELHTLVMPAQLSSDTLESLLIEQQGKDTIELKMIEDEQAVSLSALWLVQPFTYEAHMTRAPELVNEVAALTLSGYAAHVDALEALEPYGLLEPRARVRFSCTDGQLLDLRIGDRQDDQHTYVQVDETGDVYLMQTSMLAFLNDATVAQLVDQFSNLVNILKVDKLTVNAGTETFVLSIDRKPIENEDGTASTEDTYMFDGDTTDEKLFKSLYQEIIGLVFDKLKPDEGPMPGAEVATVRYQLNNGREDIVVEYLRYDDDFYLIRQGDMELFLIKRDKVDNMIEQCRQFRDGTYEKN